MRGQAWPAMEPKRVGILAADGFACLHLTAPVEAFLAASLDDGYGGRIACYQVCTIGLRDGPVRTESGMLFTPEETLKTAPALDTILIPGGRAWQRKEVCTPIAQWLLERADSTGRIVTICTGAYALAASGLLDGHEVSMHWRFASDLARRFPAVRVNHRRSPIASGPFHSASGVTAALQLSLGLIQEDYGPHVARLVAEELTLSLPAGDEPAPRLEQPLDRFGELLRWMMRNLDQDLSIDVLARRAGMSRDTFSRAFKSVFGIAPSAFVENLRLNEARRRLSVRKRALKTVASSVGFSDSDKFNRAFERRFGVRPTRVLAA